MSGSATSVASVSGQDRSSSSTRKTTVWITLLSPVARLRVTSVRSWSTSLVTREMIWPDLVRWKNPRSICIRCS